MSAPRDPGRPDDYLWDGAGDGDPFVRELEAGLRSLRVAQRPVDEVVRRSRPRRSSWGLTLAAAATLLLGAGLSWSAMAPRPWTTTSLSGSMQTSVVRHTESGRDIERLVLETNDRSSGRLHVGRMGTVELAPDTRLRVERDGNAARRLLLERGTILARISAPPRDFVLETSMARAIDLGCIYAISVDTRGYTMLAVAEGAVELATTRGMVTVPAGYAAGVRADSAITLLWSVRASTALQRRLRDTDPATLTPDDARALVAEIDSSGTATLWQLWPATHASVRPIVLARLAALTPPPVGVTVESVLAGDATARARWEEALGREWYRSASWWRGFLMRRGILIKPPVTMDLAGLQAAVAELSTGS